MRRLPVKLSKRQSLKTSVYATLPDNQIQSRTLLGSNHSESWHSWFLFSFAVQRIGCYKDTSRRAIPLLEGKISFLKGNYQRRRKAIEKCAYAAIRFGYSIIGVQNGGHCASGPQARFTFAKYGRSRRCKNGRGGPWANDVYRVIGRWKT